MNGLKQVNFQVWKDSPIDYVGKPLFTGQGELVEIVAVQTEIYILVNGAINTISTDLGLICLALNQMKVGLGL